MELQGSSQYVNLSSGINMNRNIKSHTQVCTFFNNPRLMHKHSVRHTAKYIGSTSTYVYLIDGNQWLTLHDVAYKNNIEKHRVLCRYQLLQ